MSVLLAGAIAEELFWESEAQARPKTSSRQLRLQGR